MYKNKNYTCVWMEPESKLRKMKKTLWALVGFWVNFSLNFSVSKMAVIPECGIVG